nr:tRNA glutamyl-Q(34) synthetase GluQRS [uncultured Halomonas sp.]
MPGYRGRFAPTPSGPLHFGSLVTALASFLDARHAKGSWLVRIEDIDPPRCPSGADSEILRQLEAFGLHWDEDVCYQSTRYEAYRAALEQLIDHGLVYPCSCSRKDWQEYAVYPGWCRSGVRHPERAFAWRLRSDLGERPIVWQDRLFARQCFDPAELGDVVLKRRDGLWAYQLAVVVDDGDQHINQIVRGTDLLDNTPWQCQLQRALNLPQPRYLHLPLIATDDGQKLSKQNLAPALPINDKSVRRLLHEALITLDQAPPPFLSDAPVAEQLSAAIAAWDSNRLQPCTYRALPYSIKMNK